MVLRTVELIFNDSPSKKAKDLTDFLRRSMEKIIMKGQIKFRFKIVATTELNAMRKRGINGYPAMVIVGSKERPIIDTPNIINDLIQRVKRSKNTAAPKSEDEVIDSYLKNEVFKGTASDADGKLKVSDDQEPTGGLDLGSLLNSEMERRSKLGHKMEVDGVPAKPARQGQVDRDNDFEDRGPNITQAPGQRPRQDNVQGDAGDPMAIFNRRRPPESGDGAEDDKMMHALLQRIGSDGGDF
jgi:hypothetical protein